MSISHFHAANKLKQDGKLEEAITCYRQAIERNPNFYSYHHNLAEALVKLGRFDEAAHSYRHAIHTNPNSAWSYHNLAEVLKKLGQLNEAISLYCRAIELNPNFYGFYQNLGETIAQLTIDLNSIELNPKFSAESLLLHSRLAEILVKPEQLHNYPTELYSLNDEIFLQATDHLSNENFIAEIYGVYLKREPDEGGKNHYLSHLSNDMKRADMVAGFRESQEFLSKLVLSITSVYIQKSVEMYRRAVELNSNSHKSYQNLGKALIQWGKILEQGGQLEQASEIYQQAIAASHNLAEAHYNQGQLLAQQGKMDMAIENFKKAIAIKPDWVDPYLNLGDVLKHNRLDQAIAWWRQAIPYMNSEVTRIELEFKIGNLLVEQGQLDEALACLEKAMGLTNFYPTVYNSPDSFQSSTVKCGFQLPNSVKY